MSKYIDAEKLIAEIERLKKDIDNIRCTSNEAYCRGYYDAFIDLRRPLDSLQQEQPEVDLEWEVDNYIENERYFPDDERPIVLEIAKYFYELGKARKKE